MPETISDIDNALVRETPLDVEQDSVNMADATDTETQAEDTSAENTTETPDYQAKFAEYEQTIAVLEGQVKAASDKAEFADQIESIRTEFAQWKADNDPAKSRLDNDTGNGAPKFNADEALADDNYQLAIFIESVAKLVERHNASFSADEVVSNLAEWKATNVPHFDETTTQLTGMGQTPSLQRILTIALEPMLRMRQWFTPDRETPTGGQRNYPVVGQLAVSAFGENVDVPSLGAIPMSYVQITQTKFGGQILVTGETRRFSDIPYMRAVRRVLLAGMARYHEAKGRDALLNATSVTGASMAAAAATWGTSTKVEVAAGSNTFAFDAAPFAHRRCLQVSNVVYDPLGAITGPITLDTTDYSIDYFEGVIQLNAGGTNDIGGVTNTLPARVDLDYVYVDETPGANEADFSNAHLIEAATAGTLAWADIVAARGQIRGADGDANVLWTDPDKGVDLLNDTQFVTGGAGMAEKTVMDGAIARVGGLNLFESTVQYAGIAVAFMAREIGYESIGSELQTRTYVPDDRVDDQQLAVQMLNAYAVTRPEVISVIFNANDNSAAVP